MSTVDPNKGVGVDHGTFRCTRGVWLYTTTYTPAVRHTSACLVFHHGLSDHTARHSEVLSHLCTTLAMPVYTYDAHGHGRSGPPGPVGRCLIRSFNHMVDDLLDFTRRFVVPAEAEAAGVAAAAAEAAAGNKRRQAGVERPGSPTAAVGGLTGAPWRPRIYLLGYSMGGLTCCLAAASTCSGGLVCDTLPYLPCLNGAAAAEPGCKQASKHPGVNSVDGAGADTGGSSSLYEGLMLTSCLTDPLYGKYPVMQYIQIAYVTLLSWLIPAVPLFKRNPVESGIRDPAAVVAMATDTLWYRGSFKVATVASVLWGCLRLRAVCRRLASLPLYVQHATVDVACSLPSMRAFLARVRPADLTLHVVEGAFHDLHHDPETPVLLGRMVAWLRQRV